MKITKKDTIIVNKTGFADFRHILNLYDYERTSSDFKDQFGISLPPRVFFGSHNADKPLFVLLNDMTVNIISLKNNFHLKYEFKKGFITDLASVPRRLQSIVQDDDPDVVLAAMVHDVNFVTKFLGTNRKGFRSTNILFKKMIMSITCKRKNYGLFNRIKDDFYYIGVLSPVGWNTYRRKDPLKPYYDKTCKITVVEG